MDFEVLLALERGAMRGADAARLIPPGGSGGRVFSLSILSIVPTRDPAPDPDPRPGVVDDGSSSSRGVVGMGMLSVDAVDEGVFSSSFDALRDAPPIVPVLVIVVVVVLMLLRGVVVEGMVPALGLRIVRDGVRARAPPFEAGVTSRENVDPILLVLTRASGSVPVLALP